MGSHVLIAPDKFKSSMSAREAAEAIARGIKNETPGQNLIIQPLSDGGEGLVDSLICNPGDKSRQTIVTGPLGKKVKAYWGIITESKTAVIEMSSASGLMLIPENLQNPGLTSSYGTGELIKQALDHQCPRIIVGLGGSATNDGGAGMARALGVKFYDYQGRELEASGESLKRLSRIDTSNLDKRIKDTEIFAACDVNNPLTGDSGASIIYGPQKGASPEQSKQLDKALIHYARVIKDQLGFDIKGQPGSGAAGGLAAGLYAFLGAKLKSGIELVLDLLKIEEMFSRCKLVITGEGRMDPQSIYGKVPIGIAKKAAPYKIPVIALVGSLEGEPSIFHQHGITASFVIANGPMSLENSIALGPQLLERTAREVIRLWSSAGR